LAVVGELNKLGSAPDFTPELAQLVCEYCPSIGVLQLAHCSNLSPEAILEVCFIDVHHLKTCSLGFVYGILNSVICRQSKQSATRESVRCVCVRNHVVVDER